MLNITSCLCPWRGENEQTEDFYEAFQDQIDKINKNDFIIVAGDYNARDRKIPIDGILGSNG